MIINFKFLKGPNVTYILNNKLLQGGFGKTSAPLVRPCQASFVVAQKCPEVNILQRGKLMMETLQKDKEKKILLKRKKKKKLMMDSMQCRNAFGTPYIFILEKDPVRRAHLV